MWTYCVWRIITRLFILTCCNSISQNILHNGTWTKTDIRISKIWTKRHWNTEKDLISAIVLRLGDRIMLHHTAPWKERKVFIRFSDSFPRFKIDDYVTVSPLALWPSSDMGEMRDSEISPFLNLNSFDEKILKLSSSSIWACLSINGQNLLASTLERKKIYRH